MGQVLIKGLPMRSDTQDGQALFKLPKGHLGSAERPQQAPGNTQHGVTALATAA